MFNLSKWGIKEKKLVTPQRNLIGQTISVGELVKVARSKEDSHLIDILSVSKPKRIIRNVPRNCVEPFQKNEEAIGKENARNERGRTGRSLPDSIKKMLRR